MLGLRKAALGAPLCAALVWIAPQALAAPTAKDRAEAQHLVREAKKLAAGGDLQKAVKKYKKADALAPAAVNELAMAKLLVDLGEFVEAGAQARRAAQGRAMTLADRRAQAEAKKLAADLLRRTPKLEVQIFKPEAGKVSLSVDDKEAEPGDVPVNPGKHELRAQAAGYHDWSKTVRLDEGESKSVEVTMTPTGQAGGDGNDATSASRAKVPKWAAWSTWGLTAAALGVGVGFGVVAIQTTNEVLNDYNCQNGLCPARASDDLNTARMNGNVSTAMFAIAGAGAISAVVLTYLAYRKPPSADGSDKPDTAFAATPLVGPGFVGMTGSF